MKYVSKIKISNSTKFKKIIVLEPWAEMFELLPEQTFEFVAQSENEGAFEIDFDGENEGVEHITIYAWSSCTVEVFFEGKNLCKAGHISVPEFSEGKSFIEFVKNTFRRRG